MGIRTLQPPVRKEAQQTRSQVFQSMQEGSKTKTKPDRTPGREGPQRASHPLCSAQVRGERTAAGELDWSHHGPESRFWVDGIWHVISDALGCKQWAAQLKPA